MADQKQVNILFDILNNPKEPGLRATKEQILEFLNHVEANELSPPLTSGPHQDGWRDWATWKMFQYIEKAQTEPKT